jgi:hypothetical protein
MEKTLQALGILVLLLIAVNCALSIRTHVRVWRYSPPPERLDARPE